MDVNLTMELQWYSRKVFVFIKLRICFKSGVEILEATRIWLKSQEAVEPTFCSWNLSCLFLLFSFSSSFSLGKSRNTRLTSGKTHKHVQGCSSTDLTDVYGEVKQSYGLNRGLAETVSLRQRVYIGAPLPKAALDCVLPDLPCTRLCRRRLNCVLTWSGPPSGPQSHQYQGRPQKIQRQSFREEVTLLTVPKPCCFEWSLVRC